MNDLALIRRLLRQLCLNCTLMLLLVCSAAHAQQTIAPGVEVSNTDGEKSITLNLKNAEIQAFISAISELTGKNFVVDPRVKGMVTVISAAPTSPEALTMPFTRGSKAWSR